VVEKRQHTVNWKEVSHRRRISPMSLVIYERQVSMQLTEMHN